MAQKVSTQRRRNLAPDLTTTHSPEHNTSGRCRDSRKCAAKSNHSPPKPDGARAAASTSALSRPRGPRPMSTPSASSTSGAPAPTPRDYEAIKLSGLLFHVLCCDYCIYYENNAWNEYRARQEDAMPYIRLARAMRKRETCLSRCTSDHEWTCQACKQTEDEIASSVSRPAMELNIPETFVSATLRVLERFTDDGSGSDHGCLPQVWWQDGCAAYAQKMCVDRDFIVPAVFSDTEPCMRDRILDKIDTLLRQAQIDHGSDFGNRRELVASVSPQVPPYEPPPSYETLFPQGMPARASRKGSICCEFWQRARKVGQGLKKAGSRTLEFLAEGSPDQNFNFMTRKCLILSRGAAFM